MTDSKIPTMLDFRPITPEDKPAYEAALATEEERGCEFSFANLFLWGRQKLAWVNGQVVLFSQFDRKSVYPYPIGAGDKRAALDAILSDAEARGIPCRITGMSEANAESLRALYPERFRFHCDEGSFDYVYDINDLADLPGKKYHAKRNHLSRFLEACPDYTVEPLSDSNLEAAREMIRDWYATREAEDPNADFLMERAAIDRALRHHRELELEALLLRNGDRVLAFTAGSRLSHDTFDVHFEKACTDVQGAYAAINREFARYIREKHPDVRYLDREEDMGIEGLRRAKQSYRPIRQIRKCWAHTTEDGYEY